MGRPIVGCGTLFGVVLVVELVVVCLSFSVISFIAVGVGNCDSGVFSIIAGDSGVVCDDDFVLMIHFVHLLQMYCLIF